MILQNISNLFVVRVNNAKLQSSRHMLKDEIRFLTCYGFFFLKAAQKLKRFIIQFWAQVKKPHTISYLPKV